MKLPQSTDPRGLTGPIRQADQTDGYVSEPGTVPRATPTPGNSTGLRVPPTDYEYGNSSMMSNAGPDPSYGQKGGPQNGRNYAAFREPTRGGRPKTCGWCGGAMRKSSRRVLSAISGFVLIVLGLGLMSLYGLAINFFQVPWFATFALPAGYYIGSIFVGVGVPVPFHQGASLVLPQLSAGRQEIIRSHPPMLLFLKRTPSLCRMRVFNAPCPSGLESRKERL